MRNYAVVTTDIINSRNYHNIIDKIQSPLNQFNKNFECALFAPFTLLKGDEIQGVCDNMEVLPKLLRHLRYTCKPYKIRIGIGIGTIEYSECATRSNPWELNGEAFHFARNALNCLTENKKLRKKQRTYIVSNDCTLDMYLNTFYTLYDITIDSWSDSQWQAVLAYEQAGTYVSAQKLLNTSFQNIQKRCATAHWDEINLCEKQILDIFKTFDLDYD